MVACLPRATSAPTRRITLKIIDGCPRGVLVTFGGGKRPIPEGSGGIDTLERIL